MSGERKKHWEAIYQGKEENETSWFQPRPETSLQLIESTGEPTDAAFIDVGGGVSRLVDHLLDKGWTRLSVLDIAPSALARAQARLGDRATEVSWLAADLLEAELPASYRIWHDRAVFHFLTEIADRARYLHQLKNTLEPGGHLIIATFAPEGPQACSGLPVQRYSPEQLGRTLGKDFRLEETVREEHRTPAGKNQSFNYCRFRYQPCTEP
ncbi:class I SAM-dependent methyltransferase [Thiolapillus sp.]